MMSNVDRKRCRAWLRRGIVLPGLILGLSAMSIVPSEMGQTLPAIAQTTQMSEVDRAIEEGFRLFREGSAESLSKAIVQFERAQQLSQTAKVSDKKALSLAALGRIYSDLGEKQEALKYYNQSLSLYRALGDRGGEATLLNNIGTVYNDLGNKQETLKYFNQSLLLHRAVRDRGGEAATLNNIGNVYNNLGENREALKYLNQALPLFRAVRDRGGEASTLNNIGNVYNDLGNKQEALKYYNQSLPLHRTVGDREGEATTLNNIGAVYNDLGNKQEAVKYYNQALPLFRTVRDREGAAVTLNNIGAVYNDLGNKQEALKYYNQSLSLYRALGNREGEAMTLNNIGLIYTSLGNSHEALKYLNQALPLRRAVGDRGGEATTLNNIGLVYTSLGNKQEALKYYNQALPLRRAVGDRRGEAVTLNNIAFVFAAQKQSELAITVFKQSVSVYESLRADIRQLPKEQQKTYAESIAGTYRKLADILLENDRILEAQQVLDLLKVQELEDYLRNVRGGTTQLTILRPEEAILKQYREKQDKAIELSNELAQLQKKASQSKLSPAEATRLDQLFTLQTALNQEFKEFQNQPEIRELISQLRDTEKGQPVQLDDIKSIRKALVQLNSVMLYPLILDDRLELIITTPNSPPLRRTVRNLKRSELNATILDFRRALQDPTIDPKPIAQKLYSWLIQPIEADLKKVNPQSIIYAPDAQLRYIPLAALHDGKQWLAQRYQINNITAKSLTKLNDSAKSEVKILAGAFADENESFPTPVGTQTINYRGLPFAGREVTTLKQLFPGTTAYVDRAFTRETIIPRMNGFSVVHLATHAAFIPGEPEKSFILFGDGKVATLREIEEWTLSNVDLMVLSACETGVGIKALGDKALGNGIEILGLGYQFQNSGVKATIASLWSVDDGGTQALMNAFYTALQTGKYTKAQALQQAQIALITKPTEQLTALQRGIIVVQAHPESRIQRSLDHPYYWAPFILIGNGL